jgi:3-oxoacyl-[acyl-carrier-protein] synthase-3
MAVGLLGFGSAVPEMVRTNDHWAGKLGRKEHILEIERTREGTRTALAPEIAEAIADIRDDTPFKGAKRRRVIDPSMTSSDLEALAVRAALADAKINPEDVDLLMVSSLLPDAVNPMNGPALQQKCGLRNASAWSVEAACGSFQAQFISAVGMIESGLYQKVVIAHSQVASPILNDDDPTSPTFGDGAAAAVVGKVGDGFGLLGHYTRTDGSFRRGILLAPLDGDRPSERWWEGMNAPWRIGTCDSNAAKTTGMRAPDFCREACFGALKRASLTIGDVDHYLGNQSVAWFVGACRRAIGIPEEKTISSFDEVANIGAAAILYNLGLLREAKRLRHGDVVLMYSPAVGFSLTAVVCRWWEPREGT